MDNRKEAMTKSEVFRRLRELGADRAEVSFEGGNDEGGCTIIRLFRDAEQVGSHPTQYDDGDDLSEALEAPVYSQWGSFAGDFYVNGTVLWDAATGKVTMRYDEEVPQSEHHEVSL